MPAWRRWARLAQLDTQSLFAEYASMAEMGPLGPARQAVHQALLCIYRVCPSCIFTHSKLTRSQSLASGIVTHLQGLPVLPTAGCSAKGIVMHLQGLPILQQATAGYSARCSFYLHFSCIHFYIDTFTVMACRHHIIFLCRELHAKTHTTSNSHAR